MNREYRFSRGYVGYGYREKSKSGCRTSLSVRLEKYESVFLAGRCPACPFFVLRLDVLANKHLQGVLAFVVLVPLNTSLTLAVPRWGARKRIDHRSFLAATAHS